MKKVLFSLGVAVLFTVLLTAPALAGSPFWQSDLVCDLGGPPPGFSDLAPQRPFAAILHPSGDLYVSKIFFGSSFSGKVFTPTITCGPGSTASSTALSPRAADLNGTLAARRIKGEGVGPGICTDLQFRLVTPPAPAPAAVCVGGFNRVP